MWGAILGDIAGSRFEWNRIKTKDCRLSGASTPWRRSHSPPTSSVSPSNARPARRITRSAVGRASRAGASERRHRVLHRRVRGGHVARRGAPGPCPADAVALAALAGTRLGEREVIEERDILGSLRDVLKRHTSDPLAVSTAHQSAPIFEGERQVVGWRRTDSDESVTSVQLTVMIRPYGHSTDNRGRVRNIDQTPN